MSDFIGRVAARAVGVQAGASPRVPSLFEARGAGPGAALDVIDEEVVAPAPTRASSGAPPPSRRPGETPVASPAPALLPGETAAVRVETDALPAAEQEVEASLRTSGERTPEPVATTSASAPRTQPTERAPAAASIAAPVLTPAQPVGPRTPAHALPVPAAASAEPAVRVHIGRLEVRANLQEQPRRPVHPPAARPQELSLSDYLRGRRGSR